MIGQFSPPGSTSSRPFRFAVGPARSPAPLLAHPIDAGANGAPIGPRPRRQPRARAGGSLRSPSRSVTSLPAIGGSGGSRFRCGAARPGGGGGAEPAGWRDPSGLRRLWVPSSAPTAAAARPMAGFATATCAVCLRPTPRCAQRPPSAPRAGPAPGGGGGGGGGWPRVSGAPAAGRPYEVPPARSPRRAAVAFRSAADALPCPRELLVPSPRPGPAGELGGACSRSRSRGRRAPGNRRGESGRTSLGGGVGFVLPALA